MTRKPELSAIMPMYNEEAVIESAVDEVVAQLVATGRSFQLICVDDGSTDATAERIYHKAQTEHRVRLVQLSRNFGKEGAMAAGLEVAEGDAVLLLDADLQHPPSLIPEMLARWDDGYDVVNGVKRHRGRESFLYSFFAGAFNYLMGGASGNRQQGASDFKLLDRQVVEAVLACEERTRFFRGLVAWVGFRTVDVLFDVADRVGGETKWSLKDRFRYSISNLVAFSSLPLRAAAVVGLVSILLGMFLGLQTLYRFISGSALTGFTTVILLQLMLGAITFAMLGLLSLYLAEIYKEVKGRPTFIVRRSPREMEPKALADPMVLEKKPGNRPESSPQ